MITHMPKPKLKIKAIIFDLDGTLVDSREAYSEAAETAFAATGQGKLDARIVTEIPRRLEQDLPIDDLITGVDVKRFKEIYLEAYYQATTEKTKPFPDIADTLKKLSSTTMLAVTTRRNIPETEVKGELAKFGLAKYVQKIVTSRDTMKPKPSPEALIKCAEYLHVKIRDCAVVGDSVIDIKAGKNAGAQTVAVLTGIFSREELETEKPDLILQNVKELPEFLAHPVKQASEYF
jgi:HAD superfamily hydrolase (TIGR01509 family)